MTKEEAIKRFETLLLHVDTDCVMGMETTEAINMAIKALKQPEPCEDTVSRKAVKDGFVEMCNLICPYTEKQRHAMCGSCLLGTAFDVLEATHSVTPKQRTEALKAEIRRMKRSFTTCINSDYYTGYMSALSAVEGYIAQLEGDAE